MQMGSGIIGPEFRNHCAACQSADHQLYLIVRCVGLSRTHLGSWCEHGGVVRGGAIGGAPAWCGRWRDRAVLRLARMWFKWAAGEVAVGAAGQPPSMCVSCSCLSAHRFPMLHQLFNIGSGDIGESQRDPGCDDAASCASLVPFGVPSYLFLVAWRSQ